jgi:hypothetical protein
MAKFLIRDTGFGELFGGAMQGLKGQIESGHKVVYDLIKKGHIDGWNATRGGTANTAEWGGSPSVGGVNTSGLFGGEWWQQPIGGSGGVNGGLAGRTASGGYGGLYRPQTKNKGSMTRAQGLMLGTQSALTGYSAYQSAKAGGMGVGGAATSGIFTAGSVAAGYMSAAAAATSGGTVGFGGGAAGTATALGIGMGPVGWALLAGALIVAAMLPSLFLKGGQQTSVETKTTSNTISSKINITNKNLELINRNLIALRTDIRQYILPQSAYFSAKSSLDEEFSISSRMASVE